MIARFKVNAARFNRTMEQRELPIPCNSLQELDEIHRRLTNEIATKGLINADQTDGTKFTRILPAAQFMWITVEAPHVLEADNGDVITASRPQITLD